MNIKQKITLWMIIFCAAFLTNCSTPKFFAKKSSGLIGCPAEEIEISNIDTPFFGPISWVAKCRGKTFYCVRSDRFRCKEALKE